MTASDPGLADAFDVEVIDPQYEGPIGFGGALTTLLRDSGFHTASLIGITPFYLGVEANPAAGITMLEALARAWHVDLDLRDAHREANAFLGTVSGRVARSERLQEVVANLETQYDKNRSGSHGSQFPSTGPLPPSDELLADSRAVPPQHPNRRRLHLRLRLGSVSEHLVPQQRDRAISRRVSSIP